jgi:nucleotide-binding universal stress UspA family protein
MKVFKKIMVACDLSKYSFQAIKHATELAESLKAELIIINVINQKDYLAVRESMARIVAMGNDISLSTEEYLEGMKEDRSEEIRKLVELAKCKHLIVKIIFRTGIPFEELIGAVKKRKCRYAGDGNQRPQQPCRCSFRFNRRKNISPLPGPASECSTPEIVVKNYVVVLVGFRL